MILAFAQNVPLQAGGYETRFDEEDGWIWDEVGAGEIRVHHDKFAPLGIRYVGFPYAIIGEPQNVASAEAKRGPGRPPKAA